MQAKPIDVSAFSYSRKTLHQDPHCFLKRGTGNGGTVIPVSGGAPSNKSEPTRAVTRATAPRKTKLRDFQVKSYV